MNDINQFHAELPQEQYEQGYAESDSPETDALTKSLTQERTSTSLIEFEKFARKLERERDEAREAIQQAVFDYNLIKWGSDGDCGSDKIIRKIEELIQPCKSQPEL